MSDLRQINCRGNGDLVHKFDSYWAAMEKVIDLSGDTGAQKRRCPKNEDAKITRNIVYAPELNSLAQLADRTLKYLTEELNLERGRTSTFRV